MAYEKTTWSSGDVITAEKLNKIESGIESSIGYEYTETRTVLFDDNVTTVIGGDGIHSQYDFSSKILYTDILCITFNEVEYICEKRIFNNDLFYYGDTSFSNIPFFIGCYPDDTSSFYTENSGTYSLKIEACVGEASTTREFNTAVNSAVDTIKQFIIKIDEGEQEDTYIADKTIAEIIDAYKKGYILYIYDYVYKYQLYCDEVDINGNYARFEFITSYIDGESIRVRTFIIESSDLDSDMAITFNNAVVETFTENNVEINKYEACLTKVYEQNSENVFYTIDRDCDSRDVRFEVKTLYYGNYVYRLADIKNYNFNDTQYIFVCDYVDIGTTPYSIGQNIIILHYTNSASWAGWTTIEIGEPDALEEYTLSYADGGEK